MERFVLAAPVDIHGRDFFGRRASVRLEPVRERGWFWNTGGKDTLIDPMLLKSGARRICLEYLGDSMHVFEHLGPLRFAGLDSVRIITESRWLPYDGSALLFWKACKPKLRQEGTLDKYAAQSMHIQEGGRLVSYEPTRIDCLSVDVSIEYAGVGFHRQRWDFPHRNFSQIARAKTQGWPHYLQPLAKAASLCGWPHADTIVWPQEHDKMVTRRLFARHRALDILGTLSVLCPPGGILVGKVKSVKAGHKHDIGLVQRAVTQRVDNVVSLNAAE